MTHVLYLKGHLEERFNMFENCRGSVELLFPLIIICILAIIFINEHQDDRFVVYRIDTSVEQYDKDGKQLTQYKVLPPGETGTYADYNSHNTFEEGDTLVFSLGKFQRVIKERSH